MVSLNDYLEKYLRNYCTNCWINQSRGGIAISVENTEIILEGISEILLEQKNTVGALERISGGILRGYLMESWEKNLAAESLEKFLKEVMEQYLNKFV